MRRAYWMWIYALCGKELPLPTPSSPAYTNGIGFGRAQIAKLSDCGYAEGRDMFLHAFDTDAILTELLFSNRASSTHTLLDSPENINKAVLKLTNYDMNDRIVIVSQDIGFQRALKAFIASPKADALRRRHYHMVDFERVEQTPMTSKDVYVSSYKPRKHVVMTVRRTTTATHRTSRNNRKHHLVREALDY